MAIEYVPYKQIDKQKWDNSIAAASNGLIYATSNYLDTMAENWDALVMDDYKAVMPLTWKKKYSFYYLYQPFFIASLGVFGKKITASIVNDFCKAIPAKFKYADIYLNHGNRFLLKDFTLCERSNYILQLNKPYEELYGNFRDNIKRNIKKANKLGCEIKKDCSLNDVLSLATEYSKDELLSQKDYSRFKKLYKHLYANKQAVIYGIVAASKELMASCVFFFYGNRAYYILVGNHPNGKTIGASHALINAFIKDYAGKNMVLDFEGSDIRNLAFFYSSFGAVEEKYAQLKYNKLPRLLKLLKR